MEYKIIRKEHFNIHLINTDRFKTIKFRVILKSNAKKENIVKQNMLLDILTSSCNKYKTRRDLVLKCQDLYGLGIYSRRYRLGKMDMINMYMTLLNPKYTEDTMLEESVKLLSDIIFDPDIENNKFNEDYYKLAYNQNREAILSLKENKAAYAHIRMLENMGEYEIYSYSKYGDITSLDMENPSTIYEYYKQLLNENSIDIYVIGKIDEDKIVELLDKYMYFENNNEIDSSDILITHNNFKDKYNEVIEKDLTNQSNLVIGYKLKDLTNFEMNYVMTLYNIILGSSGESKFFKNIREKHSICYYVSSSINKFDNLLIVRSGINKENYSKILKLIDKEMTDMEKGNFTIEDLDKAKEAYLTFLDEIYDNDDSIIDTYIAHDLLDIEEIDKRKEIISKVTKEDIIKVSKKIIMDTIYLLEGEIK